MYAIISINVINAINVIGVIILSWYLRLCHYWNVTL